MQASQLYALGADESLQYFSYCSSEDRQTLQTGNLGHTRRLGATAVLYSHAQTQPQTTTTLRQEQMFGSKVLAHIYIYIYKC